MRDKQVKDREFQDPVGMEDDADQESAFKRLKVYRSKKIVDFTVHLC